MQVSTDYVDIVPKEYEANLWFRRDVMDQGRKSDDLAEELWIMCSRDPLFWVNTFCWTYDPRKREPVIPFITYEYQDEGIISLLSRLGDDDVLIEKSRDMGASWICLLLLVWPFIFRDYCTFLCASAKEDLVDKREDPDSLFWKIDFVLKYMPGFLRPMVYRANLHFTNLSNNSTIDGCSTTRDLARGGRRTAVLLDEFASVSDGFEVLKATRDVTNSRVFNSTPKGRGNAFYAIRNTGIHIQRFHWSQHPEKAAGLYKSERGKVILKDPGYIYPPGFQPILDGKLRSPWYDRQVARAAHPQEIAQELDIDYLGSDELFFNPEVLEKYKAELCIPPIITGELEFDYQDLKPIEFVRQYRGRTKLWINLERGVRPPEGEGYVVGCDIATGTGATPSVMTIIGIETAEVVCEFASAHVSPEAFADIVLAHCYWFHDAFLVWESNGPGGIFGKAVVENGYRNMYYKKNEQTLSKRVSDIPGWHSSRETKLTLLGNYRRGLQSRAFTNRSAESVDECFEYIYDQSGNVIHAKSAARSTAVDSTPAKTGDNHGDRVISAALAWKAYKDNAPVRRSDEPRVIPPSCFYQRRLKRRELQAVKDEWVR